MYRILQNPNEGKKVKVISEGDDDFGKIGVIDKVQEEKIKLRWKFPNSPLILVRFSAISAKTHRPYNYSSWFYPDELEEVQD